MRSLSCSALLYKNKVLEQAAFANIALASLGTLAAGMPGIDNRISLRAECSNAGAKIVLALLLLVITAATALLRWWDPKLFENRSARPFYVAAYFVSFALALVLAFLGGVILYGF